MRLAGGLAGAFVAAQLVAYAGSASAQEAAAVEPTPAADVAAGQQLINILNYRVEGNTVLPRTTVEQAVMPFLGPNRKPADAEAARAALEQAYHDAGFQTVGVELPEQDARGGVVRLTVTELKVGRLRVTDSRFYSPNDIKAKAPSLAEGQIPNYKDVSSDIADLNKVADRTVTPSLRAGDTPGTVDVDLQVEDHIPLHGSLELNDRMSSRTRRLRTSASWRYANLFQLNHSISLQGQFAPQDPGQGWVASGSYVAPIGTSPYTVVAYGVHSDSDVAAVGGINVLGSGDIVGLRGIYAFTTKGLVHQLTVGVDYKSFNESLILGADLAATPIDYVPVTAQYSMSHRDEKQDFDISFALNLGLRGIGADETEFRAKRFNASANWAYLRSDISYLRRLPGDVRAGVKIAGQFAGAPLISNEQFAAGGLESVRGYYESQELGDDGVSAQFDLESPSLHRFFGGRVEELRLFAFVDGAYVRIRDPLADLDGVAKSEATLLGAGIGINVRALRGLNFSGLLSVPIENTKAAEVDLGDDVRAQFRLWSDF